MYRLVGNLEFTYNLGVWQWDGVALVVPDFKVFDDEHAWSGVSVDIVPVSGAHRGWLPCRDLRGPPGEAVGRRPSEVESRRANWVEMKKTGSRNDVVTTRQQTPALGSAVRWCRR